MNGRFAAGLAGLLWAALATAAPTQPAALQAMAWNEGADDCEAASQPPLQARRLDATTFVLRQGLCVDFEANFLYLLIGNERALLIDSGAVADPALMPLARQVMALLPEREGAKLPLLVAHTHGHRDHRQGGDQPVVTSRGHFGVVDRPAGESGQRLGQRPVGATADDAGR